MSKNVEQKYRKLTDVEHVLLRPGMYVGSIKPHDSELFLLGSDNKFKKTQVTYNPAFLKIFDEIISNSVDEHKRNPKLNKIEVTVNREKGLVTIWDNGGIPVQKHKEYDEWIPELIFSNLKTGSNFDDSEERLVAGTNGVGATLTNIFSKEFRIKTCDGKKIFEQTFTENMHKKGKVKISDGKKGFTEINYLADLERFGMTSIDQTHFSLMKKRVIDAAACNPKLSVSFNGEAFTFKSFKQYTEYYIEGAFYEESERWKVGVGLSEDGFQQVSFVNSVETKDGGTHVEYVANQITNWLREKIKKRHKVEVKPSELRNHMFLFVEASIVNSGFSSQTKEKLITEPKDFGSYHEVSEKMLKLIFGSEIIKQLLDWIQEKKLAEERKQLRALNKFLDKTKIIKLIDAKNKDHREKCTLAIFEGDSASSAFRQFRDPMTMGAFPLRGKFINVMELPNAKVIQNVEVKNLMASIGLKMGEEPKDIRFGKIFIYSDADPDGDSIAGLLINFFGKYWPELFERGVVCRVMTPLVVCKKGNDKKWFYTNKEFEDWEGTQKTLSGWSIEYKKGLAALENEEYKEIIQNPNYFVLDKGRDFQGILETWFAGDSAPRKMKILGEEEDEPVEEIETPQPIKPEKEKKSKAIF
jgi:DNA topoisomerase-2